MDSTHRQMAEAAVRIGKVEWGTTHALPAEGHALHVLNSVNITAEHFEQTEDQKMHGLYVEGSETVICHTGTSPNSPTHARILAALWNRFVEESIANLKD